MRRRNDARLDCSVLTFGKQDTAATPDGYDPVYLILAMTADNVLRMKPQNLLTRLPTRRLAALT